MKPNRRHISKAKRDEVYSQTGGACYYCGYLATALDHVVPHSYVANDSERNLVPVCNICNSIAGNKHFDSLQAKKDYILKERGSLKWKRRLSAMTVTVVVPSIPQGMPKAETPDKPKRGKREKARRPLTRLKPKPIREKAAPKVMPKTSEAGYSYIEDDLEGYIFALNNDEFDQVVAACEKRKRRRQACINILGSLWGNKPQAANAAKGHPETTPPTGSPAATDLDTSLIPPQGAI